LKILYLGLQLAVTINLNVNLKEKNEFLVVFSKSEKKVDDFTLEKGMNLDVIHQQMSNISKEWIVVKNFELEVHNRDLKFWQLSKFHWREITKFE
jgi:hypothetical protein